VEFQNTNNREIERKQCKKPVDAREIDKAGFAPWEKEIKANTRHIRIAVPRGAEKEVRRETANVMNHQGIRILTQSAKRVKTTRQKI